MTCCLDCHCNPCLLTLHCKALAIKLTVIDTSLCRVTRDIICIAPLLKWSEVCFVVTIVFVSQNVLSPTFVTLPQWRWLIQRIFWCSYKLKDCWCCGWGRLQRWDKMDMLNTSNEDMEEEATPSFVEFDAVEKMELVVHFWVKSLM